MTGRMRDNSFKAVITILCILLFCVKLTGEVWHMVIGTMLVILCVSHICLFMIKMKYQEKKIRIVDEVLMGALAAMFLTGMLLQPLQGALLISVLHKLSGVVFTLGLITHMIQHKKQRKKTGGNGDVS